MNNMDYIDSLSQEELDSISPYVIQLWLRGADNNEHSRMVITNEVCNPYIFSLAIHKTLLLKLMCVANGLGVRTSYSFRKKRKVFNFPLSLGIIMDYYDYSESDAKESFDLMSKKDIMELAELVGSESETIKKLKVELK